MLANCADVKLHYRKFCSGLGNFSKTSNWLSLHIEGSLDSPLKSFVSAGRQLYTQSHEKTKKKVFSSKCSPGHEDCSIENPSKGQ